MNFSVLSYIILFDFDPRMRIYESFVLEDLNILNEIMLTGCIKKYQSGFDVEKLIKTLSEMAVFGASNIDWKKKESICLRVNPDINTLVKFSRDEQGSLEYRVRQISSAAYSVIPGEEWLRDLLLFFVGVQPTTNFLDSTVRVFQARIWRILDIHPEFSGLAQSQKRAIWNRSIPMGVAFMLVKKECANRGNDQLRVSSNLQAHHSSIVWLLMNLVPQEVTLLAHITYWFLRSGLTLAEPYSNDLLTTIDRFFQFPMHFKVCYCVPIDYFNIGASKLGLLHWVSFYF